MWQTPDERLRELEKLSSGWLDGRFRGEPIDPQTIQRAKTILTAFEFEQPRIYPTEPGGLQFEWTVHGWQLEVVLTPDALPVTVMATHPGKGELSRTLSTGNDTKLLATELRAIVEELFDR